MNDCSNCENKYSGNYCSNCGTPHILTRINGKYILNQIGSVINFDKGILYTIRELTLRPGISIRKFILEDRNRLVKPIFFLIICSLIYTLAQQIFHFEDSYIKADFEDSAITKIFEWIQSNYGYGNIFMGIFIGLWTKILFRKSGFNIYEILILIFFTMGIGMLIYAFFGIIESLTKFKILRFGGIIGIVYSIWGIGSFFDKHKPLSYIKGLFSYLLGYITSILIIVVIGFLVDLITK